VCLPFNNYSPLAVFTWNEDFHLRWLPHQLTPDLCHREFELCGHRLAILEARKLDPLRMLATGEESWFVLECQHSIKWSAARDKIPTWMSQTIGTAKIMLTMI
jgi:hypothetical protein